MPAMVNPVQISAGAYHTCALDQVSPGNTEVKCWGYPSEGSTTVPPLSHPRQISSHGWHSCALDDNGMKCWGRHAEGQAPDQTATPPQSYLYSDVINPELAVTGYFHTCAIQATAPDANSMRCWGDNRGAQSSAPAPALVNPQTAEGGFLHTCAIEREAAGELKGQQRVRCWTNNDAFGVIPSPAMTQPVQITSGWRHSCALDIAGVHCWGAGEAGEVDDPHYGQSIVPTLTFDTDNDGVANVGDAFPLDVSESIDTDKDGIGNNADADNDNDGYTDVYEVAEGTDPLRVNYQVAAGSWHTCAIDEIGLKCWGDNREGQLGVDSNADGYVDGLVHPRQVSAGSGFTCVLDDKGVRCWGSNETGQLNVPALVHPQKISAGMGRACAVEQLDSSGYSRVTCWGDSPLVSTLANPADVTAHGHHTCATDSTNIVCWGRNEYGQAEAQTLTGTVTSLGSGQFHSCAIADGDVVCWGADSNGQVSLPSEADFNNAQAVSGGALHTCVLDKAIDGTTSVHCFALNPYYSVATDPVIAQLVNPSQVAVGLWYACALDNKGLHCWGSGKESPVPAEGNEFGQSIVPPLLFDHDLDGVPSDVDDLPRNPSESVDTDHDGVGNNADADDDNDGVLDLADEFPLDESESVDTDHDGAGNNADTDDDNDDISDGADNCPLSVGLGTDQIDTDGDTQGNLCDTDDDNDTLPDIWESNHSRDPLHADYQLAGGARHNCVLDDAGIECWGRNAEGQAPALVNGLVHPRELSVGVWHSCAVDDTNNDSIGDAVKCWGSHGWGQSGGSDTDTAATSVLGLVGTVKQVSAGEMHSCALDSEGVKCWGNNENGSVTSPAASGYLFTATAVPSLINPRQVSVGKDFSCALDEQGVKCWGVGYTSVELITTAGLVNPTRVSAGMNHVCALDGGNLKCWGSDSNGQISSKPSIFASLSQVSASHFHTCALDDGDVLCWGAGETNGTEPDFGQSVDQTTLQGVAQVAASWYHSCALGSDGVHCWGYGGFGSLDVPNLDIDADGDGLTLADDNCPLISNTNQTDADSDGYGNVCDTYPSDPGRY